MRDAKQMPDDELAYHLGYYFKHPPAEGLGFVKSFKAKVNRGHPITDKMRWKARHMVNEKFAAHEPSLVDDGDA